MAADSLNKLRAQLIQLELIIIDEISMVGNRVLLQVDFRLKEIFSNNKLYGGISVICSGDFKQLRPVRQGYVFEPRVPKEGSLLAGQILWEKIQFYELTEIMRQKEDYIFAKASNNLSNGDMTQEEVGFSKANIC